MHNPIGFFDNNDDAPPKEMTDRQRCFLDKASRIAMKSVMTHKHGCVIVYCGEIISEGYNHFFTHMCHKYSIHAEVDAINKAKKMRHILPDCEMYVVRIGTERFNHCLKYSKPCTSCTAAINKYGIKKIYYSTNSEYERLWLEQFGGINFIEEPI